MLSIFITTLQLNLGTIGKGQGLGPFSGVGDIGNAANAVSDIISKIIGVLTVAGGIWFIIQFLIGAFKWITSGGDKTNVEAAKEHLTHSVIALAILVSAYIIAGLVGAIFGLDILNPQKIIPGLGPSGGGGMAPSIIAPPATGPGI